ncbi:MAG TPA: hypothetical protein VGE52_11270, partial [Pirellulales bacterium]
LGLQNKLLLQTGELPAAVETLELVGDLLGQFNEFETSFHSVRNWMTEVIILEPSIERALNVLQPLIELGQLRRLGEDELRSAARSILERREAKIHQAPITTAQQPSPAEASPPVLD